ncbi:isocyanide synthase family protein [Fluoribacter gormanii]|uniref:L-tyrosine/L-tryptophan isonitrile synthase family protein n=1 Tax=Fluoribacter gormanii TaxID=464 RepID=UPI002244BF07|nr:L-tyrosine/L-tryptophan isonitrile synthase family protein [Fluoribacter gormanii]MCW8469923.1 isocyanide synthase family protein [Fluoribacter gormanii]
MTKRTIKNNQEGIYQVGLNRKSEAVISAHFMHDINQNANFHLYSAQEFSKKTLSVSSKLILERLLPLLMEASDKFVLERVSAAKTRLKKNYKKYGINTPQDIGLAEKLTEVMFDRQFLKGSKSNVSRLILVNKIKELVAKQKPIKMIIPALPYKSSSPLKSRGSMPDLSEISFLLGLVEIAKTIDFIYRQEVAVPDQCMASFTIICDGRRFNSFLNEADETIQHYQDYLNWWIKKLGLINYLEIMDYQYVISNYLPQKMQLEKAAIRENVRAFYSNLMLPLLNPYDMVETMNQAIKSDPEPETSNPEGRYIPLFKSLMYIVNYKELAHYACLYGKNYVDLYSELTRNLFEPYTKLTDNDLFQIELFLAKNQSESTPTPLKLLEYLRQSMLNEAWVATINYLAEIRSDRDLLLEPISVCFPDHIRWTIHAKPGQLAVLTNTALGDPIQPWHGVSVFMRTKHNKIKLYTLPVLLLEGNNATPVTVEDKENELGLNEQPLFYVYPDIKFTDINDLFGQIKQGLIRKRKH